ncbi:DNA-binding transcriptional LysR family regulator [Prauserella sediminis]|uniref:DNA-binding transcriptional LysR family regulator n=1 Tax=Prauserella sediminis TaxID=577680 RepID=A0A839XX69_9PSEU|nr:LysR family transcriptional regulator [Prauserella sediminis]MBB3665678.1 DNA-binding transcriptional LysR family regulator [Prauserella sediminis]
MDLVLHLRGFVAVAEELSVSEAALRLGLDQPLLSRRLRTLERELGVELVDRSRRQIALTPDGVALLPRARHLVEQADHLVRTIRDADPTIVTLAAPSESDPAALARLLRLLDDAQLAVDLTCDNGGEPPADSSWTIVRCEPASARWTVRLGAASAPGGSDRPVRLSGLRPRRGAAARPVLVLPHDLEPPQGERLHAAADAAGLSPALLRAKPPHIAFAEALAGRAHLFCTAAEARRHGLSWAPLADPPMLRGYRLAERDPLPAALARGPLRTHALDLLGAAVSAEPDTPVPSPSDSPDSDSPDSGSPNSGSPNSGAPDSGSPGAVAPGRAPLRSKERT